MSEELKSTRICYSENVQMMRIDDCIVFGNKASLQRILEKVTERKTGEWIEENRRPRSGTFQCSVCHRTAYDPQPTRLDGWVKRCRYKYCPNCGVKMDWCEE